MTRAEWQATVHVRSICSTTPQARVTIERIRQLGCWPDDWTLLALTSGQRAGHVYLQAGALKGRRKALRITPEGEVIV